MPFWSFVLCSNLLCLLTCVVRATSLFASAWTSLPCACLGVFYLCLVLSIVTYKFLSGCPMLCLQYPILDWTSSFGIKHVLAVNTICRLFVFHVFLIYICVYSSYICCDMFLQWLYLVCPGCSVLASSGLHACTCSCESVRVRAQDSDNLIHIGDEKLERVWDSGQEKSFKLVGIHIDENLKWEHHIKKIENKIAGAATLMWI